MIGLATRGYLRRSVAAVKAPTIIGVVVDKPSVDASFKEPTGPSIVGSMEGSPSIHGSSSVQVPTGQSPSIVGSREESPTIRKK